MDDYFLVLIIKHFVGFDLFVNPEKQPGSAADYDNQRDHCHQPKNYNF